MDILPGFKLCRKKLHWYLPDERKRGCLECRRIYARTKYKEDEVYRKKRIASAIKQEQKNQEKYNARKRTRYKENIEYQRKRKAQINKQKCERWKTDLKWKEQKQLQLKNWIKKNPEKRNHYEKLKKLKRKSCIASWANKKEIQNVYKKAHEATVRTGIKHHVDHVYPLISDFMCGLHVETNLQVLTEKENTSKGNRWWPGQLDCQKGSIYDIFPKEITDLLNDKEN